MEAGASALVVATITAVGGVIVALIQRGRRDNKDDHALVMGAVQHAVNVIHRVDDKLDKHLQNHDEGRYGGAPARRD
jgi:hypothetical protein